MNLQRNFFMATSLLIAHKSTSSEQVGACIVNNKNQIVAIGYNITGGNHAELNAILNASQSLKNCTLYVSLYPCNDCADIILQSGIKKVVYYFDKYPENCSKLLDEYGIENEHFGHYKKWFLNFTDVEMELDSQSDESDAEFHSSISWKHFFMATAYLIAKVNNMKSQIGVCIVNDSNQIISIGCKTEDKNTGKVTHAEVNAIRNAWESVKNCTLYITVHPCNTCSELIAESNLRKVVYNHDLYPNNPKKLNQLGIESEHYIAPHNLVVN